MIVTDCPAIATVPLRAAPALAAIVSVTVPVPVPLLPEVTVTNAALLVAVQLQLLPVTVTVTVDVPPPAPTLTLVGEIVYVQLLEPAGAVGFFVHALTSSATSATSGIPKTTQTVSRRNFTRPLFPVLREIQSW